MKPEESGFVFGAAAVGLLTLVVYFFHKPTAVLTSTSTQGGLNPPPSPDPNSYVAKYGAIVSSDQSPAGARYVYTNTRSVLLVLPNGYWQFYP